jgi:N-acetylglutamate synthase-like GNAT family acetyltransferase
MKKAGIKDLKSINKVIELCLLNRPVSDRIKKLTLSSLLFKPTDLDYMAIWVVGEPITGVLGLQQINEGMLIHSIYVNPSCSNQGVGSELLNYAYQYTVMTNQNKLIVKAFYESIGFFKKTGFTPSNILNYPHTLELAV